MLRLLSIWLFHFLLVSWCIAGTIRYDFNTDNLSDWEPGGQKGQWQIEDGELSSDFAGFPSSDLVIGGEDWNNYTIECRARIIETFPVGNDVTWAGIVLRYNDTNNCYVFGLDMVKQRANFDLELVGQSKIWLNFPYAIEKDKYYKLKATAEGENLQFYIDDILIHELKDRTHGFGRVGLLVLHAHAHFDDFIISGEGIGKPFALTETTRPLTATWGGIRD